MKSIMTRVAITLITMAMSVAACGNDDNNEESTNGNEVQQPAMTEPTQPELPTDLSLTRSEQELVERSNDFAFRLASRVCDPGCFGTNADRRNGIISPLSITFVLGMLNNGATGETQQQINKVLGFGDTGAAGINNYCYKLLTTVEKLDSQTQVYIANTIYVNKGFALQPQFVSLAKSFYNAEPESRDFNDGKTMDVINQWASDHTAGMIDEVLDESTFNPFYVSYLLNAVYFKGTWTKKFNKQLTHNEAFTRATWDGKEDQIVLPIMRQMDKFDYAEDDNFQAVSLPYGNGNFRMTILLPKLPQKYERSIVPNIPTSETFSRLLKQMETTTVYLKLPKFETETEIDLKGIMWDLGMPKAFSPTEAEFSLFCNEPTYIDLLKQNARIQLDEEKTEAAAVTKDGMDGKDGPTPKFVTFYATRPFLYVIHERTTGAIFFIGNYTGRE